MIEIGTGELDALASDLADAPRAVGDESLAVVRKGALNIKNSARRRRRGSAYLPRLTYAITYESRRTPTGASADIGPERGKPQGNLGHIPEHGTLTNAPRPYMAPAGDEEQPRFERAMLALAERVAIGG